MIRLVPVTVWITPPPVVQVTFVPAFTVIARGGVNIMLVMVTCFAEAPAGGGVDGTRPGDGGQHQ